MPGTFSITSGLPDSFKERIELAPGRPAGGKLIDKDSSIFYGLAPTFYP